MMLLVGLVICVIAFVAVSWWEISKPLKGASAPNMGAALGSASEPDTDDLEINPATGLFMTESGVDMGGNPYGFDDDR